MRQCVPQYTYESICKSCGEPIVIKADPNILKMQDREWEHVDKKDVLLTQCLFPCPGLNVIVWNNEAEAQKSVEEAEQLRTRPDPYEGRTWDTGTARQDIAGFVKRLTVSLKDVEDSLVCLKAAMRRNYQHSALTAADIFDLTESVHKELDVKGIADVEFIVKLLEE